MESPALARRNRRKRNHIVVVEEIVRQLSTMLDVWVTAVQVVAQQASRSAVAHEPLAQDLGSGVSDVDVRRGREYEERAGLDGIFLVRGVLGETAGAGK